MTQGGPTVCRMCVNINSLSIIHALESSRKLGESRKLVAHKLVDSNAWSRLKLSAAVSKYARWRIQ